MLFVTHADWNTIAIFTLLSVILAILIKPRQLLKSLYRKPNLQYYLTTKAKIRSLQYAPSGIVTIDSDGIIIAWNGGAANMFGYKEDVVLGKALTIVIPERYREKHIEGLARLKNTGQSSILGTTLELEGLTKNKTEFPIRLTIWKWTEDGHTFFTGIIKDITEQKKKEAEIQKLIAIYKKSEELNECGAWSWDILNDKVITTEGFNKIFDIDDIEKDSTYLLKRIYHKDLPAVEAAIKKAFDTKEGYTVDYHLVARNGTLIHVQVEAETHIDSKGNLINITGTIHKLPEA